MNPIIGVLLAAGSSRRFGMDKLTQTLPDSDVVAVRACRNLQVSTDNVVAVVNSKANALNLLLQSTGADVRVCQDAELGMGVSLAFGVRAYPDAAGWVIALADMPWLKPETILAVANTLRTGADIVAPVWQGQRGHPVGFSNKFADELSGLTGDVGAKTLLQIYAGQTCMLDCDDPGILWDIDKPEDLTSAPSLC